MTPIAIIAIVVVVAALIVIAIVVSVYNGLVALKNRFKNAYAQIDVQLKRRYDLIPNLVETAKGYLAHERQTLEAVIAARNEAATANQRAASDPGDATAVAGVARAEGQLGGALTRFFGLVEAYPQLKGDASMRQLSDELTSTENRIAFARQAFNDAVMQYNTARESFPGLFFAGAFPAAQLLEATQSAAEREAPKVKFT
jgi:LemA protein